MSQENVEIVRRGIDAWNRGDRAEVLAYYAPEAEWHTSGEFADQGVYRGHAGIERLWAELEEDMDDDRGSRRQSIPQAPRLLGIDEHGREVLTYIDGKTIDSSPVSLSDGRLVSAAQLIRRFHDTTAGTALVQTGWREPSPISALNCRCRRAVEASGRWSLPYAAPAWRGGQPALGVA